MAAAFLSTALALLSAVQDSLFKLIGIHIFRQNHLAGLPNGSMGWPFLGETIAFLRPHKSTSLGTFLQQRCSRFGKVFKSNLFFTPTIVSCDHELNTFVLQNEERLFRSSYPKPVHDILGKLSMMLVSGELHKRLRSVAVGFINESQSRPEFLNHLEKLTLCFVDSWKGNGRVAFFKEVKKLTFYFMMKNLLNIEPEDPLAGQVLEDFLTFMKGFVSLPLYIPGSAYAKAIKARMRISDTLEDAIKKRRESGRRTNGGGVAGDSLDEMMSKGSLKDDEMVSVLLDLLLAGYETTSGLMSLAVYFLGQAPDALQRLQEEHKAVREGKKAGELLNWDDYKQMEFTSHVISEALRCGNLVKFVHRKALKNVKFKEYLIPEGWQVLPIFSAAHMDPCLHENPNQFNPWRWDDPSTGRKVTPFGGGLRVCPGVHLGKVETAFFLHHFVLNFRWRIEEDDYPISRPYLDFKRGLAMEMERLQ